MPKLNDSLPKYRSHRASGQAVVTLNGRDHYLGPYGTKASKAEYERLVGEWLAGGRRLSAAQAQADTTIVELAAAYLSFAEGYYRKDGEPTRTIERVRMALRILRRLYGPTRAAEFGPLALQAIQGRLVRDGKSRRYVNYLVEEIKRVFKWGVSREIVPPSI